jgi:prepilin-type N-terminal cleavage/methylation domain-containing protein
MRTRKGMTLIELIAVLCIVGIVLSIVFGAVGGCAIETSDGARVGYLQKFSHRHGYVGSSWEGELVMAGLGRAAHSGKVGQPASITGDVFAFSVLESDEGVGHAGEKLVGRPVKVSYHEVTHPAPWKSATGYRASAIEPADGDTP